LHLDIEGNINGTYSTKHSDEYSTSFRERT
jgi:hypothetical protein